MFAWNTNNHLGVHYRVCDMILARCCMQIKPVKHKIRGSQFHFMGQQLLESACSINQIVWPFWCLKLKAKSPLRPPFTSSIHFVLRLLGLVWCCCIRVGSSVSRFWTQHTCHGVFILHSLQFRVRHANLVVGDTPDDSAGDFLHVPAAHVELDALWCQGLVAGASNDN